MADCAGLYHAGAELVQSEELISRLGLMAARFESAAYVQAQREGRSRPQEVIGARIALTRTEWADKGMMMVFSQDFEDWTDYCRSFAGHVGVDLGP